MDPSNSSSAAGLTFQVCFPGSRDAVMDNLNRQREEGRLCDLSIHVQGQVFRAHRCVLAASSPYFHDQVLLKNVTTVSLPSVMDPVAFESVLSSAYTGQLSLVHEDIVNYVTVASFLQMWHIVDKCTEILKRPRPSADVSSVDTAAINPGSASRQQSPSSTDCLDSETEGKKKEKKPDALPPLATWRRPQQFPRWRPRPSSGPHLADSQLEGAPAYVDSYYSNCEESWVLSHAKSSHFSHDTPRQSARQQGAPAPAESQKQKGRFQQRVEPSGGDRASDKNREMRDMDESREKRKNDKREIEADEGVGEEMEGKKEMFGQMGSSGLLPVLNDSEREKSSIDLQLKDRVQRATDAPDPPSGLSCDQVCQPGQGIPGPSSPVSARLLWQMPSWSQQEQQLQAPEGAKEDDADDGDMDFECLAEGTLSRETFDEIEDGTGQISQRPLVPASPDFTMGGSAEANWPSTSSAPAASLPPSSDRHASQSSSAFPPSSPPTPSSSSSVSLAGASYTGKVHFCHCGKAYTLKSMRDRHVKMQHLNLRPFGCPVCTKSFKMKHHLTKHLKTHGGLRPFECGLCGKKVVWRDSFLRHQARCERLASGSSSSSSSRGAVAGAAAAAADMDDGYGYGFEDGEAFLPADGQVKVEDVDFGSEMESGMSGLLGTVPGIVEQLRTQVQNMSGGHVFKEEANESFIGN